MDEKLESEILEVVSNSPFETDLNHAKSTKKWLLKLKPDADYALQIAALAHDIERGVDTEKFEKTKDQLKDYKNYKQLHSEKSAKVIVEILEKHNYENEFILKVKNLVLKHEFGGDYETDNLKDADSLSFFEENLEQYYKKFGQDRAEKKVKFMYERMSNKAKKQVKEIELKEPKLKKLLEKLV